MKTKYLEVLRKRYPFVTEINIGPLYYANNKPSSGSYLAYQPKEYKFSCVLRKNNNDEYLVVLKVDKELCEDENLKLAVKHWISKYYTSDCKIGLISIPYQEIDCGIEPVIHLYYKKDNIIYCNLFKIRTYMNWFSGEVDVLAEVDLFNFSEHPDHNEIVKTLDDFLKENITKPYNLKVTELKR